jgi:23S rRNA (pseudouridine1915-N3)-methyltransferase
MNIKILSVAKTKDTSLIELERNYINRVRYPHSIEIKELDVKISAHVSVSERQKKEGTKLLEAIPQGATFIALDEDGKKFSSQELAIKLQHFNSKQIIIGVGGAFGWCHQIKKDATLLLSLSPLTFPAYIARMLIVEQIYRCVTILEGTPYHKE